MIVVISDLHLTDESTSVNVNGNAFGLLAKDIEYIARYAEEIKIILLGDIFDLVQTNKWCMLPEEKRPWNGKLDPNTAINKDKSVETNYLHVLDDILNTDSCKKLINCLDSIKHDSVTIKPEVTYVIANHDQPLNNFKSLQDRIASVIPGIKFQNGVIEPEYNLSAYHGHEWDENCYGLNFYNEVLRNGGKELKRFDPESYKISTIGEVITAELLSGLIHRACKAMERKKMNKPEDKAFIKNLQNVHYVRPFLAVFVWLSWFTENKESKYLNIIREALKESILAVTKSKLGLLWDNINKPWFRPIGGDITDWLDYAYDNLDADKIRFLQKIAGFIYSNVGDIFAKEKDDYEDGAEDQFNNSNNTNFIVYGHTHYAKYKYLHSDFNGNYKLYINSGTFVPLIEGTKDKKGFAESSQMSMVYVYNARESMKASGINRPVLDFWRGIRK